jgi:hypothetical protein
MDFARPLSRSRTSGAVAIGVARSANLWRALESLDDSFALADPQRYGNREQGFETICLDNFPGIGGLPAV